MRRSLPLTIIIFLAFSGLSPGQTSESRDPGVPLNYSPMKWYGTSLPKQTRYFMRLPGISPDYMLGAGDVIKVDVVGNEMLSQAFKISNTGHINFLLLGDIKAAGLTAEELEKDIADRLRAAKLVNDPEVLVYIESYEAKPIYVVGEVDTPGEFVMSQQLTLMDAIFLAGGLDYTAARYGYLHRRVRGRMDSAATGPQQ
ncbi:MAG: polysaccharide export protein, partial [Acidobacteria bacterium]|nr:polysaccharide export protein [Acidobacteriota bacterium]